MKRILDPKKIEDKSFEIIDGLLASSKLPWQEKEVAKRVIHATTDLDYAKELLFHPMAVESGLNAIRKGRDIICDVNMVRAGINKTVLSGFGGKVICLIDQESVVKQSSRLNIARAILAMRKSAKFSNGAIISVGNAPTALFEICNLVETGKVRPALIIGTPVGFVGAVDSKKKLTSLGVPYITNISTKGGSSVAAAITNALLKLASVILVCLVFTSNAYAMHISEGILPMNWAGMWYLVALPFLVKGIFDIKKKSKKLPSFKTLLGMMGAVVFIISCMPVPVPTAGTCSHPAGTGISAILIGPIMSIFVTSIALLFQALFLAHGGITTWGADIVSMGVAGSFAGYIAFRMLRKYGASLFISGFVAGLLADWATYATTSFELASALHGGKPMFPLFMTILVAFIPTQLPLGILEGFLTGGMIIFVHKRRPDILASLGVIKGSAHG